MLDNGLDRNMPHVKDGLHIAVASANGPDAVRAIEYLAARGFDVNHQVHAPLLWLACLPVLGPGVPSLTPCLWMS